MSHPTASPTAFPSLEYRADIDGLRAVAVVAVILFHAGVPGLSGGYVGVDIFFVISGYLITRIIYGEVLRGEFSITRFYERRVRRIFPALFAMLLATSLAGILLLMPEDYKAFSKSIVGAALSASNFVFWQESGYFEGPSELKPLLHTWSLAIEEQFYVVFPIILIGAYSLARAHLKSILVGITILSFALSIWGVKNHPEAAFFLLPFRAWELGLGSLLALDVVPSVRRRPVAELLAALGLILVLTPIFAYSQDTSFPGLTALVPTLGAALIIYSGSSLSPRTTTILRARPMVIIGLLSYSLYLWHWPLFVYASHYMQTKMDLTVSVALVVTTLFVGWVSWRWIEKPFRRIQSTQKLILSLGTFVSGVAILFGVIGIITEGLPGRLSPRTQEYLAMIDKNKYFQLYDRGHCFLDYAQTAADYEIHTCLKPTASDRILVVGDSFAAHLVPGLRELNRDYQIDQYTATSCRPFITDNKRCNFFLDRFFKEILPTARAETIVLSAFWLPYFEKMNQTDFKTEVEKTLKKITSQGAHVILFGQSPTFYKPVPYSLAAGGPTLTRLNAVDASGVNSILSELAASQNISFVDPYSFGCRDIRCVVSEGGEPFHWDNGHLTLPGSLYYGRLFSGLLARGDH